MKERLIKLTIAYDGSDYHGWQVQPGFNTVQQTLNEAACGLFGCKVHITGASRTDAGVSALGQVGAFTLISPVPTENIARALNDRLPDDMWILEAVEAPRNFDVIGAVKNKLYRYTIFNGPDRPVLDIRHCWHIPQKLDTEKMNAAAARLIGKKDFKSFACAQDKRKDSVRTIFRGQVVRDDDWIRFEVEGDGFLYNMVRNITGTLVEVGIGRMNPEKIDEILDARDRRYAGPIAPPQGLCLVWIRY